MLAERYGNTRKERFCIKASKDIRTAYRLRTLLYRGRTFDSALACMVCMACIIGTLAKDALWE